MPQGAVTAELILINNTKELRSFSLGRQRNLTECLELLAQEIRSHERDAAMRFYTTADFSYGGFRTDEINVEHVIVGAKCVSAEGILESPKLSR